MRTFASLLLLVWFFHLPAHAQETKPETYAGFEGKPILKVEISVKPTMDASAFRSLLKIKGGTPFSSAAVQQSVNSLEQTKQFSKVQVSIEPEPVGLSVLFILEPASYVGIVTFPGIRRQFAYTQLLQAANIPEQSPYFDGLLPKGQKDLLKFLQVQGYFSAEVRPETQRDDPHQIVNLIFHVELGPRAKVGNINMDGVTTEEAERIRKDLHSIWARVKRDSLKPGQPYSPMRIGKAVDYIRAHLRNEDRLAPVVRHASSEYHPQTNRADITFEVNPGPLVSVRVMGARLWKRTMRREIPIYEESAVDRDLVDEGERNLVSYFQSKGYFDVKVTAHYEQLPNQVSVDYQIDEGSRHRVEGVDFRGNHYFGYDRLEAAVAIKRGHSVLGHTFSRGKFSDELLRKSSDSIVALYQDAGFAKVDVTPKVADFEPLVDVTFQITEGEQDKVGSLRLEGNRRQSRADLSSKGTLNLQPGKPYSPRLLEMDRNRILATYLDAGYLNATFKATVLPDPENRHLENVVYTIDEGPQGHVSDVVLLGEKVTRANFARDVTAPDVSPRKPLSEGKLFTAESNLYNLNIFDWVSIKPLRPISDQAQEEVLIKVHELPRYTLDIGGGLEVIPRSSNIPVGEVALPGIPPIGLGTKFTITQKSFFGPRFSFSIARHNILGRAETATFSTVLSRLDQSGSFTYADPRLRGSTWSSLFSLSGQRSTDNPLFTAQLGSGSFQVEKTLDAKRTKKVIVLYSFQRIDLSKLLIPDLVLPQDQRVRLSTISVEYLRDGRDNPLDAHHGVYQTLDFGVTPTALGSSANFVRFLGQTAVYLPVRPWLTWASNVRLGLAAPFSGSMVPLSQRFFTGGADSLRGFPINGAGPQRPVSVCSNPSDSTTCTVISVPVGGNMLFILNSEARFPLKVINNLGGVFFYDGGNVNSNINFRQLIDDYTSTVGIGVRYRTPVGPVRFDVGYRLTNVPGVKATQYFVTLGQSF
jgi:outer membrane protein insertion porin family